MFLSFIVPVYKTGKYLERCVKSLLEQDIDDYEVLLIDDGSPDNSGEKCDELGGISEKIKVYHKENEGLGITRNFGIKHATGEYLIFVDSDDYFKANVLKNLKEVVTREISDIVVYKYERVLDGNTIKENDEKFPLDNDGNFFDNKALATMCIGEPLKKDMFEVGPAWKEMWKREFLIKNNLFFPSERIVLSEDYPFAVKAFYLANKVSYFDSILYFYCYNDGSLTNTYNSNRQLRAVEFFKQMEKIINEYELGKNAIFRNKNNFIVNMLQSFKHIVLSGETYHWKKKQIKKICNDSQIRIILEDIYEFDAPQMKLLHWLMIRKFYICIYLIILFRYK